jgi:hypothetical protein
MPSTFDARRVGEPLFVLASGLFLFMGLLVINVDDLAIYYSDDMAAALWGANARNYRYLTVAFVTGLKWFGLDYLNVIGALCLALPVALLFCVRQLLHIVALPSTWLVPVTAAILLHGLWADLHPFTMSYASFALALFFTSLCLAAIRRLDHGTVVYSALAVACGLAALLAYQPFLLVLPFAASLLGLKLILSNDDRLAMSWDVRVGCSLVAVFSASCALFWLVSTAIASAATVPGFRPVSFANIPKNIGPYLETIVDQVLSRSIPFHFSASREGYLWPNDAGSNRASRRGEMATRKPTEIAHWPRRLADGPAARAWSIQPVWRGLLAFRT